MAESPSDLLSQLLKDVSRSFYLTLRVLPGPIRPQIGLAYLLARASDTIADTDAVPPGERLRTLHAFRDGILHSNVPRTLELKDFTGQQSSPAEQKLLRRLPGALDALSALERQDGDRVREVLKTIISGQALDVERFASANVNQIVALESNTDLDDYTYRVAGCVGEFWTRMCRAHLFPKATLDDAALLAKGVRFGKGLQLVNILRDLPADLRIGRCYLPQAALREAGLRPSDLLVATNEARLRPVYTPYLDLAEGHLQAGWDYTNDLPRSQVRLRLACAWPVLIGVQTLARLRRGPVLDPAHRIKVSRRQVRGVIVRSLFWYSWPGQWRKLFQATKVHGGKPLPETATLAK